MHSIDDEYVFIEVFKEI